METTAYNNQDHGFVIRDLISGRYTGEWFETHGEAVLACDTFGQIVRADEVRR
jgi:hypothetical protein